jgi:glycosyltransferase involved in cell wall biosynthesis
MYKFPDSQKSWIRKAVKLGSEIIENEKIDIIYTTAPPFSDFIIASELKEKYGMPMIVDYQDSWLYSETNFYPTPYHRFRNSKIEQEILRAADETITVNRRIKELIISEYHYIKHEDINVINHGFDPDDYSKVSVNGLAPKNKMRFTYTGSFFNSITPEYFFEALSIVFKNRPELRSKIEACFLGLFSRENLKLIKKFNVSDVIFNPGYVSHSECIKYMLSSDVLWFTVGKDTGGELISPVKLSEYIGARKPILACIPDGAAKQLLKGYDAFKIAEPDNPAQIAEMIIEYYQLNEQRMMPSANEEAVNKFDVDKLTYQLVRYFEFLIDISPEFDIRGREMARQSINSSRA